MSSNARGPEQNYRIEVHHPVLLGSAAQLLLAMLWTVELASSGGRTRTYDKPVNSRLLCQLSYAGSI